MPDQLALSPLGDSTAPVQGEGDANGHKDSDPYEDAARMSEQPSHGWQVPELTWFDVFSLIVNNLIGTGIFTAPASIYLLTGQKSLALGLWAIGFCYSVVR